MPRRTWANKFRDAFRGLSLGMRGQSSFAVHAGVALVVVILAGALRVGLVEWCLLLLCIALVLAAELFNTALECLAREVDRDYNPGIGAALDIASAAVLATSVGSAVVGGVIFIHRAGVLLFWWS